VEAEFDHYIDNYRDMQNKAVALSGEESSFFAAFKTQKLTQWFPHYINAPISILDFGSGDGLMTDMVRKAFCQAKVFGVDPSGKSIEFARQEYPEITFKQAFGPTLPFDDATFDLIFAAGVFHHIKFYEHKAYIQDIIRVLKPGGSFVLFELNPLNPLTQITVARNPIDVDAKLLTPWYAKRLLKKYGTTRLIFYCFFPRWFAMLRSLEPYMKKIPLGSLYAVIVLK
jgi:ubiquinone/menaquinone biosynthesis C-methylase UbiE